MNKVILELMINFMNIKKKFKNAKKFKNINN